MSRYGHLKIALTTKEIAGIGSVVGATANTIRGYRKGKRGKALAKSTLKGAVVGATPGVVLHAAGGGFKRKSKAKSKKPTRKSSGGVVSERKNKTLLRPHIEGADLKGGLHLSTPLKYTDVSRAMGHPVELSGMRRLRVGRRNKGNELGVTTHRTRSVKNMSTKEFDKLMTSDKPIVL